jgi:hypothetical protein
VVDVSTVESVTFPPGTFLDDTVVTLSVIVPGDAPLAPAGAAVLAVLTVDAQGAAFGLPAVITFPYDPSQVADPSTLGIWVYMDGRWQLVGGTVNTTAHTVSVSVVEAAMYALMSRPLGSPPQAAADLPDTGTGAAGATDAGWIALLAVMAAVSGSLTLAGWSVRRKERNDR